MSAIRVISAGVLGALCWGEFATWRASRQELPSGIGAPDGIRTVVVLGYPAALAGSTTGVPR